MKRTVRITFFYLLTAVTLLAQSNLDVKGLGFFKNLSMDGRLSFLHNVDPKEAVVLDAALLEDSAFLLMEQVKREGYLQPTIIADFLVGDRSVEARWQGEYSIQIDVDFVADHATFYIKPGVLSYYDSVLVAGVDALPEKRIERFFIPGGVLFYTDKSRAFSYENFNRRVARLIFTLKDLGYRSARVVERTLDLNDQTGAAAIRLTVEQGPFYQAGDIEIIKTRFGKEAETSFIPASGQVLTRGWEQENRVMLRNEAYRDGYPDAKVRQEIISETEALDGVVIRNFRVHVDYGKQITLAGAEFRGDDPTKRSVLRRQINLDKGERLDLIEVSEARRKLMNLGIYKKVDMSFEARDEDARTVIYDLTPAERKELQLKAGWGSYEQARLGFRWEHKNPWGRAHSYEVDAKQSFKSTSGKLTYSIPQIFGTDLTAYSNAQYNYREEISFDRTAQGVAVGTSTFLVDSGLRLALEYGYTREDADRDAGVIFETEEEATVASVTFRSSIDRRDDFLNPTSGYSLYFISKTASQFLGGSVNFQKIEIGGTYHFSLAESILLHVALRSGAIFPAGAAADNIPFNERFFMGGENSVRGYLEGGAAPLDVNGDEIGSEAYLLGNLELEQRVFGQFSVVAFADAVTNSRSGFFDDAGELLYSVGLGLRYNTVVGPIRLEYGHNPDPRDEDPDGTLHFSIGFPF